jgi:threonine dehydratase
MTDGQYVALVEELDRAIARVDGRRFVVTPFRRADALSARLGFSPAGGVWVKDETGNVSGSHKARHLMGLMVHLKVIERLGALPSPRRQLAIASCGNAALAAAVVAAAARWPLQVFVPTDADQVVVSRLKELHAVVTTCPREEGVAGDPTYLRLQRAIEEGALPFTCQGNQNGLAIEGGLTLGYEMATGLAAVGVALDRLVVQVGGGALGSACAQALFEASRMGALPRPPVFDTVQTEGAAPLARAHARLTEAIAAAPSVPIDQHLEHAAVHRSEFMWPWELEPRSVAHGILDDETYDWLALERAMLTTHGTPLVVDERTLKDVNRLARRETGIDVDHTGSAGLAGLVASRSAEPVPNDERIMGVLFTGASRRERLEE